MTNIQFLHQTEANAVIESVDDAITKHLLTNVMFHFFKVHSNGELRPTTDFDMLYFVSLLRRVFEEHDVLKRILAGERVGAFFDDDRDVTPA